mgnify:CR=1 FL=1|jgi:2-dehydro-3-deoxyphosphogluconate aldolase/(4S)-4-hydroxy-2-oxoglutarate aldolase
MDARDAAPAIAAGARFVTSPVHPEGLVDACARAGALAIPGALTPSEIAAAARAGARAVKLFPAGPAGPATLRCLLSLGPFAGTHVLASGGILPDDAAAWLAAGAAAVAIGAPLVGADCRRADAPGPGGGAWDRADRARAAALLEAARGGA